MAEFESVEHYLPETVKEIVGVIGFPATEKLIKECGGTTLYFSNLTREMVYLDKLKEVLGSENALKFKSYIGECDLYLPRCDIALKMLRNQQIYMDFCHLTEDKKQSGRVAMLQLCPKYGLSDRTVWDIVRSFQQEHHHIQTPLF